MILIRRKNINILGIDPGLASTGYGVIKVSQSRYIHIAHGTIDTEPHLPAGKRLCLIQERLIQICHDFAPDEVGMETIFFAKNSKSALPVAEVKGVLLVTLEREGIPVREYAPQEIKLALTGHGRSDKRQIQELVKLLLGLPNIPEPDHAADALAVAICCCNSRITDLRMKGAQNV